METPNIQLYNLFRQDLHLTDGKSLELMHLLDKEYKSSVKEDIVALSKQMSEGFQKVDARFEKVDDRFEKIDARFEKIDDRLAAHDKRFDALDSKIDKNFGLLDSKIDKSFDLLDSKIDKNFGLLDSKIDIKTAELRTDIHKSHADIVRWMVGIVLTILMLVISSLFKK